MTDPSYVEDLRVLAAQIARVAELPVVEQVRELGPLLARSRDSAAARLLRARQEAARDAVRDGGRGAQYRLSKELGVSEPMVSRLVTGYVRPS